MRLLARRSDCVLRLAAVLVALAGSAEATAAEPVALHVGSFTVTPSAQPLAVVTVKNLQETPYQGTIAVKVPQLWRTDPAQRQLSLGVGETAGVSFYIKNGVNRRTNSYPVEVLATGAGATVVRKQNVVCASAPYYKPTIDGDPADWDDAIPITFDSGGKKTMFATYWNRRRFSLLVAVEEDKLIGLRGSGGFDAVQLAISPEGSRTGTSPREEAARYEFLFVATGSPAAGKCFRLATPGMKLAEAAKARSLGPLEYPDAEVAVSRKEGITYYECAIPFRPMRDQIRPSEGREFCMSVLVHDCDGTGTRDWGEAAGLWPSQRNRLAWSPWQGATWGQKPPFDNKLRAGLCSSKY